MAAKKGLLVSIHTLKHGPTNTIVVLSSIISHDVSLVQDEGQLAKAGIMNCWSSRHIAIQHMEHCSHVILVKDTHDIYSAPCIL